MEALMKNTESFTGGKSDMQKKRISVSSKRQITIPLPFFNQLGINNEVECYLKGNEIVIRPVNNDDTGYFAEEILKDLVKQGYTGDDLIKAFSKQNRKMQDAVASLINEADLTAANPSAPQTDVDSLFKRGE